MFLASGSLLHQLMTFDATPRRRLINTALILGAIIPVSIYHVWADEIVAHEVLFGILVLLVGRRTRSLISEKIKNPEAKKRLGGLATFGMISGGLGYFLWNIDFHLCSHVTAFKRSIGLPWAFLFELHGWWHILTGIGAYIGMALVEYLVTMEEGQTGRVEDGFVWPVRAVLRDLEGEKEA
jgi:dihydroceramidase